MISGGIEVNLFSLILLILEGKFEPQLQVIGTQAYFSNKFGQTKPYMKGIVLRIDLIFCL